MEGNILTPQGWVRGRLRVVDGRIAAVDGTPANPEDNADPYVLPGFIDLHIHGGGGVDLMEGAHCIDTIGRTQVRFGTTSFLLTTMTAPEAQIRTVLAGIGERGDARAAGCARVLGVHLEGPYISPLRLGAQPDAAAIGTMAQIRAYLELAPIKVVTIAPEISGHLELIEQLAGLGLRVQLGHSAATYDDACRALHSGARGFTHLFNAMSAMHHREPGMVGAALAHAEYAELIPDLLHVHPGAIRAALRAIPRLYVVTDGTAAVGMPDGAYHLGEQSVTKCLGAVRLADGTLAGSALTMDQALRNLVSLGFPLDDVSKRLSLYPASYLGLADRGRLEPGAWADAVVLDRSLMLARTYVEGEAIVDHA
ncbi:N-acetylglucosamine-6-phosphate deacetylase [Trinickia dinghuensis]|uniref:N-acetylglucosamine-6-phosphate deacetylase n=1 Tax=Trinickia dinghuensis TaxID=2291023 RepID=A0A3D8JPE3_9BURK|nr:N-acetylglucosamine-6-phosphate deacetylase [Trinickia dinghuensis]RDU94682.1 N-acetylglucosamine-6-phosphate deacetylase [Trinickia dinghuensis]